MSHLAVVLRQGGALRTVRNITALARCTGLCHGPAMTDAETRQRLTEMLTALDAEDLASAGARSVVELDQSSTGRLSRMDALQHQAMAQAQLRRRAAERQRIRAALGRLDTGEYGYCTDCGEAIAPARLAADPAIARCAECTRGA